MFTKGGWEINKPVNCPYTIHTGKYGEGITQVATVPENSLNAETNAHLIAAAPDLYEALKGILQVATPIGPNSRMTFEKQYLGGFKVLGNRLDTAVEAIRKAEGK